jgi:hypothetical protein
LIEISLISKDEFFKIKNQEYIIYYKLKKNIKIIFFYFLKFIKNDTKIYKKNINFKKIKILHPNTRKTYKCVICFNNSLGL